MDDTTKLRVLIVEAVPLMRLALGSLTRMHPLLEVCGEAVDAPAARMACVEKKPDLIVLGLEVARGDGLSLLREFGKLHPGARVLVLGADEDSQTVERAFRAGARGYVTSTDEQAEVLAGLDCVLAGRLYVSPRVSQIVLESMGGKRSPKAYSGLEALSDREREVFRLTGRRMGTTAIGKELGVSVKTVETHQSRIKEKLHLASGDELHRKAEEAHRRSTLPSGPSRRRAPK